MYTHDDTIVAPATASGGALSVIRLSGERAVEIADRLFRGRKPLAESRPATVRYGLICDGERIVDDVVATLFRAPNSYTGEDSVEFSCHGSQYITSEIIRLAVEAGARLATAGEFTSRAFLAGRIDLSQAEAVADMIAADSQAAHAMASTQLRGGYSSELNSLRADLLRLTSLLELELDFSEEDVTFADRAQLRQTMGEIGRHISRLKESFQLGNAIREGVAVAIIGAPNAGKSTLLNRLLGENRAMVSEIAGTTRDTIEERMNIDGVVFRFIDTAGLHETSDRLEQMGIERTKEALERAQIVVVLNDGLNAVPKVSLSENQRLIEVANKMDLRQGESIADGVISISALTGEGVEELLRAIRSAVDTRSLYAGDSIVSSARHREALHHAGEALNRAIEALDSDLPTDLLSEDIRQVLHHIGCITGDITSDEILQSIFSKFCIGK